MNNPHPLNPKGTWRTYTTAEGLAGLQTEHIAEDAEGYLWIATWDSGVSRFDGEEFCTFTTRDGLPSNRVQAILLDRQGRLWFGTQGGVCWWDGRSFQRPGGESGMPKGWVSYLFEDREGRLWLGGDGVLGYCDGAQFHDLIPEYRRRYGEVSSRENECDGIAQDERGDLWFGFDYVVRYDGARFYRYGEEQGLSAGKQTVCQGTDGKLWVGTGGKIWRCDGEQFLPMPVEFDGYIRKIQQDQEGRTWFCTGGGAFVYDGAQLQRFTAQEGLVFNVVNAMCQDREGLFWFATRKGVVVYTSHRIPPRIRILQVNAGPVQEQAQEVEVFDSARQVIFEYKGLSFRTSPKDMLYTCRLVGHEEEWQPATRQRQAVYRDLPLGEYTFEVRAIDRDLNYSEPARVQLKVIPDPRDARIDELERRVQERTKELEEKNRALVVEAALERVRARALGMHRSEDLAQVATAVFQELIELGFSSLWRCWIAIIDEPSKSAAIWLTTAQSGQAIQMDSRFPLAGHPVNQAIYDAWKRGDNCYWHDLQGEELLNLVRYNLQAGLNLPEWRTWSAGNLPKRLVILYPAAGASFSKV